MGLRRTTANENPLTRLGIAGLRSHATGRPLPQAALRLAFSPPQYREGKACCPFGR